MTLREAIESLPVIQQQQIIAMLAKLSAHTAICYRACSNLACESRLTLEAWKSLFKALLTIPSSDESLIQAAITESLRRWILHGPVVTSLPSNVFGRAVTLDFFCRLLIERGYFSSLKSAKQNIRSLLHRPSRVIAKRWQSYQIGKYLMWSTAAVEKDTTDPFHGMNSADEIRGVLGLDVNERGLPLVLLVYDLPSSISPRFPTIAEAYAGDVWNYFFTPAPVNSASGLTLPWPEFEDQTPRPEVVHGVITGAYIVAPLREAL